MPLILLIAAGVLVFLLESENEREKHPHDGSHSVDRVGGNQPGGIPQENRERVTEQKPDSVPVPEPTNKKD